MKRQILTPLLFTLILIGCVKEKAEPFDYRWKFTGEFLFYHDWAQGAPPSYGGSSSGSETVVGSIRLYNESDEQEQHELDNPTIPSEEKIVITLDENNITFTQLNEDGSFVERDEVFQSNGNTTTWKQNGYYSTNRDTVYFHIEQSLGVGWETHDVIGIRQ